MNDEMICYCFEYTVGDLLRDFEENGRSTIMAHIAGEKKAGHCRCAETNPKGV